MKAYAVEAVVLRLRPLGEADRIITLFSREHGKLSAVGRGARRPASRFGGRLEFFTRVEATLHAGRSLDVITAVRTVRAIWEQLVEPEAFAAASYIAEVIDALCEPKMAVPELYQALIEFHESLASGAPGNGLLAAMDLQMLAALGVAPELESCARCGSSLGTRPLAGGRAWLSPQAGGLICTACARSLQAPAQGMQTDLISLRRIDFAGLQRLRGIRLREAAHMKISHALVRATRSFVEAQMGRRSKVYAALSSRRTAGRRVSQH